MSTYKKKSSVTDTLPEGATNNLKPLKKGRAGKRIVSKKSTLSTSSKPKPKPKSKSKLTINSIGSKVVSTKVNTKHKSKLKVRATVVNDQKQPAESGVKALVTNDASAAKNKSKNGQPADVTNINSFIITTPLAVQAMSDAASVDGQADILTKAVNLSAKEATNLVIQTAFQAQQSATKNQETCELVYTATKKALEKIKSVNYELGDLEAPESTNTQTLLATLKEVEETNKGLQEFNSKMASRIETDTRARR